MFATKQKIMHFWRKNKFESNLSETFFKWSPIINPQFTIRKQFWVKFARRNQSGLLHIHIVSWFLHVTHIRRHCIESEPFSSYGRTRTSSSNSLLWSETRRRWSGRPPLLPPPSCGPLPFGHSGKAFTTAIVRSRTSASTSWSTTWKKPSPRAAWATSSTTPPGWCCLVESVPERSMVGIGLGSDRKGVGWMEARPESTRPLTLGLESPNCLSYWALPCCRWTSPWSSWRWSPSERVRL